MGTTAIVLITLVLFLWASFPVVSSAWT